MGIITGREENKNCGIGFLITKQKLEGKTKFEELSSTVISHRSLVIVN